MTPTQKNEENINTLFKYRAEDRISMAGVITKVNFICVISLIIFTAVVGQIVLTMSKRNADNLVASCANIAMSDTNTKGTQ